MNVSTLLSQLGMSGHRSGQPPHPPPRRPAATGTVQAAPPAGGFGEAATVTLSEAARRLLAGASAGPAQAEQPPQTAPAPPAAALSPPGRTVTAAGFAITFQADRLPTLDQLGRIHVLAQRFAGRSDPMARTDLMAELRRHRLHPDQIAAPGPAAGPGAAPADRPVH
jgi:hypothetical protein